MDVGQCEVGTEPGNTGQIEDIFLKNTKLIFLGAFFLQNIPVHRIIIIAAVYIYIMLLPLAFTDFYSHLIRGCLLWAECLILK